MMIIYLMLICFFRRAYSLYLFSYVYYGKNIYYKNIYYKNKIYNSDLKEYILGYNFAAAVFFPKVEALL